MKGKVNLCVRNDLRILTTSNRNEIRQIRNLQEDTVACICVAFRRKNLLSLQQKPPNRTSVQPFIIATLHTATDRFRRENWAQSESTEFDHTGGNQC